MYMIRSWTSLWRGATVGVARKAVPALLAVALVATAGACGGDGGEDAPDQVTAPGITEELIAAAEEEGQVVFTGSMGEAEFTSLKEAFEAEYPGIEVQLTPGGAAASLERFAAEVQRDSIRTDVFQFGDYVALQQFADQGGLVRLDPEAIPAMQEYDPSLVSDYWVTWGTQPIMLAYHEELLSDPPQDWQDALDPRFKGRIGFTAPSVSIALVEMWVILERELGSDVIDRFLALDPRMYSDTSVAAAALAAGEVQLIFGAVPSRIVSLAGDGAPISLITTSFANGPNRPIVIADGPHPNAARLFTNFLLSREGQQAIYGSGGGSSFIEGGVEGMMDLPEDFRILDQPTEVDPERERIISQLEAG
jgi:iron(III) transport system substrate-binding protein